MEKEKESSKPEEPTPKEQNQNEGRDDGAKETSLQDRFEAFKRKKVEKLKMQKRIDGKSVPSGKRPKAFKEEIREKFVATAKKYYGVPYAQRFHSPGDSLYGKPLYLDCCALVRAVVSDLKEDFGFVLGRWNQAYQFDTLPIELELKDMKPGDLIFYSGVYNDEKRKQQRHNMVHVEIFIGGETGEQSIGARWFKGVVQLFDSFKFSSTSYHSIKYHFRSIETWLDGVCKSHCAEHRWDDDELGWSTEKYSIFTAAIEDQEETVEEESKEAQETSQKEKEGSLNDKRYVNEKIIMNRVFVGKGNNDDLVREYFGKRGWYLMDQRESFSSKFFFKWTETRNQIDYRSFKEKEQVINHIEGVQCLTQKQKLVDTLQEYDELRRKLRPKGTEEGEKEGKRPKGDCNELDSSVFLPRTYRMDRISDCLSLLEEKNNEKIWICKPYFSNRGKGIRIVTDLEAFKSDLRHAKTATHGVFFKNLMAEAKEEAHNQANPESNEAKEPKGLASLLDYIPKYSISSESLIQEYIRDPFLIEGQKFDFRGYLVIFSVEPLVAAFKLGYIRRCFSKHEEARMEEDPCVFITNLCVQTQHPLFKHGDKEKLIWSLEETYKYMEEVSGKSKEELRQMELRILAMMSYCVQAAQKKLDQRQGMFTILGCDIVIDSHLNPFLIEINSNPAYHIETKTHADVIPGFVHQVLDNVLKLHRDHEKLTEKDLKGFHVLFNQV